MDQDRIAGAANKAKGAVKSAVSSAMSDGKLKAEGKLDNANGSVQSAVGLAKDAVRGALNRSKT